MKLLPSPFIITTSVAASLALVTILIGGCGTGPSSTQMTNSKYHAGERWSYKTRDGEEQSTFVIGSVEAPQKADKNPIVHISVEGLKLAGPNGKVLDHIGHMPMSQEAVDKSVTTLVGKNAAPAADYAAGYEYWKTAGNGAFGMTVKQAVNYYEQVIQPRHK